MDTVISKQRSVELAALLLDLIAFDGFQPNFQVNFSLDDAIEENAPYLLGDMPSQIETRKRLSDMLNGDIKETTLLQVVDDDPHTENGEMFAAKFSGALVVAVIAASETPSANIALGIEHVIRPLLSVFTAAGKEQMDLVTEYVTYVIDGNIEELAEFDLSKHVDTAHRAMRIPVTGVTLGKPSLPKNMVIGINEALDISHHTGGRVPESGVVGHDLSHAMFGSLSGHILSTSDSIMVDKRRSEVLTDLQVFVAKNRDRMFSGDEILRIVQGTGPMV